MKKHIMSLVFLFFTATIYSSNSGGIDSDTLNKWRETMKYGISQQRIDVIKTIERNKTVEAYSIIEDALIYDVNSDVRKTAAYSLISLYQSNQILWQKAIESETNSEVQQVIIFGISELGVTGTGARIFDILTNCINDNKLIYLASGCIKALGQLKYQPASEFIYAQLTNILQHSEIRGAAAIAMGDLGTKEQIAGLEKIVMNPGEDKSVRMFAAYAMGKTGDPAMLDILFPLIENEKQDLNIRLWAIAGMGYIQNEKVFDLMMQLSKVDNFKVRLQAIKALRKLKDERAKELLIFKALYDPDDSVRSEAKQALSEMGVDLKNLGKKNSQEN